MIQTASGFCVVNVKMHIFKQLLHLTASELLPPSVSSSKLRGHQTFTAIPTHEVAAKLELKKLCPVISNSDTDKTAASITDTRCPSHVGSSMGCKASHKIPKISPNNQFKVKHYKFTRAVKSTAFDTFLQTTMYIQIPVKTNPADKSKYLEVEGSESTGVKDEATIRFFFTRTN